MKKDKRIINPIFAFILGLLIAGGTVSAISLINSSDVGFTSNKGLISTNVQDAIDEVYSKIGTGNSDIISTDSSGNVQTKFCIRASKLHGSYGQLGTKGTLTTGDAFDCDINGDGKYDSDIERFYYIGTRSTYNGGSLGGPYVGLIYFRNVVNSVNLFDCERRNTVIYKLTGINETAYNNSFPSTSAWPRAGKTGYFNHYNVQYLVNEYSNDELILTKGLATNDKVSLLPSYYYLKEFCSGDDDTLTTESLLNKCRFLFENLDENIVGYSGYYIDRVFYNEISPNESDALYFIGAYNTQNGSDYRHTYKYETTTCNNQRGVRPMLYLNKSDLQD